MPTIVSVGSITIVDVNDGAPGPAVVVTGNRPLNFAATDGVLDSAQPNIVLTAEVFGLASAAYVWTFLGFETSPVSSGTSVQTITMAQFGTSRAASVTCTVNGLYTSQVTIVRAERSTAAAGATVGADFGRFNVTNTVLNEQFASGFTGWVNRSGAGEVTVYNNPATTNGSTDGKYVYFGNSSGNDQVWAVRTAQLFPYDPNKLYRMRVRCRQTWGSGELYIGFEGIAADGTTYVTTDGQNLFGSQHYFVASEKKLPTVNYTDPNTWTELVGYAKGSAAQSDLGEFPSYSNPCRLHVNVKYFRPLVLANYNYQLGTFDLDYVIIEEGTVDPGNLTGKITQSNVTTWIDNAAIGNAQIGTAAIGDAQIRDAAITNAKIANAAITNAKIGDAQVDTLKIAGNAVTVPLAGESTTASALYLPYADFGGGSVQVILEFSVSAGLTNSETLFCEVIRDGTIIKTYSLTHEGNATDRTLSGTGLVLDAPGAGSHQYWVRLRKSNPSYSGMWPNYIRIICLGVKR